MIIYFIFEKIVNTILVMKKIVGLDLGTNSIGWALINAYIDEYNKEHLYGIEACGSRIIPMDAAILGNFYLTNCGSNKLSWIYVDCVNAIY